MKGDLDHPPIVLLGARDLPRRLILRGLVTAVVASGFLIAGRRLNPTLTVAEGFILLLAVSAILLGARAYVWPGQMNMGPEGIRIRAPFGVCSWRWSDIDGLLATQLKVSGSGVRDVVVLIYAPSRHLTRMDRLNGTATDMSATQNLPRAPHGIISATAFGLPVDDLLALLKSAKARWSIKENQGAFME